MIRVVGANPAMDRVSTWGPLRLGEVNRARSVSVVPGGKGFNVARAIIRLGEPSVAYGFLGGRVGEALRDMISREGVVDRHTLIAAGTRVCFIVVEPHGGRTTVLNEPGPAVRPAEVSALLDTLASDTAAGDLVVLSGSLPDSVDPAVAGKVVDIGNAAGARTVVDIHGEALKVASGHRPWMLKCNRRELLELLAVPGSEASMSPSKVAASMQRLRTTGIETVVVTLGADGALLADGAGSVRVRVPAIDELNPTGSGDLLLAGLTVGIARGLPAREAIVLGAACGTAGATYIDPELPPEFDAADWQSRISMEPVPDVE